MSGSGGGRIKCCLRAWYKGVGVEEGGKKDGSSICGIYISEADIGSGNIKTGQDRCSLLKSIVDLDHSGQT